VVSLVRDRLMYELDTAGEERFPGHRGRGEMGKRGIGKGGRGKGEERMAGQERAKRLDAFTYSPLPLSPFPSSCPFLRFFRHRYGFTDLISADLRAEADRQSIPTVDSYYS